MKLLLKFSIVALLVIAVTGCSKGYQPSNTMLQPSNTMPCTAATTAHAIPWCRSSQLSISGGQPNGAAGKVGIIGIGLQNISNTTCRVKGYPKLQMLNALGKPILTYTIQGTSYYGPSSMVKVVNLTPYFRARFDLLFHNQTGYGTAI